ncbi:MAG: hypothetical protein WCY30_07110 [Candidatus Neomarinimicrobiota bacterium]|jgi:hypothetical protein
MDRWQGIDPSALFISAKGIARENFGKIMTYDEFLNSQSYKSSYDHPFMRTTLQYDHIEATTRTNRGIEKVNISDYDLMVLFEGKGEIEFLKYMNERQFRLIQTRLSILKNKISGNYSNVNVHYIKKTIEDDERLIIEFNKWFITNNSEIPKVENEINMKRTSTRTAGSEPISIDSMHSLYFIKSKCDEYSDQVTFKLYNDEIETPEIKISQMDGSLLLFLAEERKRKGVDWLKKPNNHAVDLEKIFRQLQLKGVQVHSEIKWFNKDTKDSRYKIASRINKEIQVAGFLDGNLLVNRQVDYSIKAIYTLTPSIINIIP